MGAPGADDNNDEGADAPPAAAGAAAAAAAKKPRAAPAAPSAHAGPAPPYEPGEHSPLDWAAHTELVRGKPKAKGAVRILCWNVNGLRAACKPDRIADVKA